MAFLSASYRSRPCVARSAPRRRRACCSAIPSARISRTVWQQTPASSPPTIARPGSTPTTSVQPTPTGTRTAVPTGTRCGPLASHSSTPRSPHSLADTKPCSASEASICPAGRSSGRHWRARWPGDHRSCCSTMSCRRSTPRPKPRSCAGFVTRWPAGLRSSHRIEPARSAMPRGSWCSTADAWSNRAGTMI